MSPPPPHPWPFFLNCVWLLCYREFSIANSKEHRFPHFVVFEIALCLRSDGYICYSRVSFLPQKLLNESLDTSYIWEKYLLILSAPSPMIECKGLDIVCCQEPQFGLGLQLNICFHLSTVAAARCNVFHFGRNLNLLIHWLVLLSIWRLLQTLPLFFLTFK